MKRVDRTDGGFVTFLDTLQRRSAADEGGSGAMLILDKLFLEGVAPATSLLKKTGLSAIAFGKALDGAESAGLIRIDQNGDEEVVRLTDSGRKVAQLTQASRK